MGSESKKYDVIISDEAAQMLVYHARFLAQVNERAALRLISPTQSMDRGSADTEEKIPQALNGKAVSTRLSGKR